MSQTISAEAIQLEAREASINVALSTLKNALELLRPARCCEQAAVHVDRAHLAIQVAIKQLGGDQ